MRRNEEARTERGAAPNRWALLILAALSGGSPEFHVGGRAYRLSRECAFRLEEVHGRFIYYIRSSGALERRLEEIAARPGGRSRRGIGGWAGSDR